MKILFVAHSASLSGAPLVLLNLVRWIRQHRPEVQLDILLIERGDYLDKYKEVFNEMFFASQPTDGSIAGRIKAKLGKLLRLKSADAKLLDSIAAKAYDIVYSNTALMEDWGIRIKNVSPASKLVVHIHELDTVIKMYSPNIKDNVPAVDKYISVSKAVSRNLVENIGIPAGKVSLVYAFIDLPDVKKIEQKKDNSIFKIGASGFADWRKGYELFILVANVFKKKYPQLPVVFEWVGDVPYYTRITVEDDIRKLGLEGYVVFSGKTYTPLVSFSSFDVFLLLSREDPFPLVCLEAGSLGKPFICFERAGGMPELVEDGGGVIVPYLDIEAVVESVWMYYNDRERLAKDGKYIKEKVKYFDTNVLAPQVYAVLESMVTVKAASSSH